MKNICQTTLCARPRTGNGAHTARAATEPHYEHATASEGPSPAPRPEAHGFERHTHTTVPRSHPLGRSVTVAVAPMRVPP